MEDHIKAVNLAPAPAAAAGAPVGAPAGGPFGVYIPSRSGSPLSPGSSSPRQNPFNLGAALPTWEIKTEVYRSMLDVEQFRQIKEETAKFLTKKKEPAPLVANAGKQ